MLAVVLIGVVVIVKAVPQNSSYRRLSVLGLIALAGFTAAWIAIKYVRSSRLSRFRDRENLSLEDIYARYFRDSGIEEETFFKVWQDAAKRLNLPMGKLRPTDRFDQELKPLPEWAYYDDYVEVLLESAMKSTKRGGLTINIAELQTLGDFVSIMAKLYPDKSISE